MKTSKKMTIANTVIATAYTIAGFVKIYQGIKLIQQQKRFNQLKAELDHQIKFSNITGTISQELKEKLESMDPISMDELEGKCYTETLSEDEVPVDILEKAKINDMLRNNTLAE